MECNVKIDNKPFNFQIEGDFFWGNDQVLYYDNDNVISHTEWKEEGFKVLPVLTPEEHAQLVGSMRHIMGQIFEELDIHYNKETFSLEDYHKYVDTSLHQKVISKTRFLTYENLSLDIGIIAKRISNIIGCEVSSKNPRLDKEIVILRISRPDSLDINPPHRDGYLDIWKDTLNLWLPIVGCNKNSSLPVVPKSHKWNEQNVLRTNNKGASIGSLSYHVPGIVKTRFGLDMIRPDPQIGEALVFTPFLIHGCAVNWNKDITRFSLELRLFNKIKSFGVLNG